MKRMLALLLTAVLLAGLFSGCGMLNSADNSASPDPDSSGGVSAETVGTNVSRTDGEMFTDRDLSGEYENTQTITLGDGDVTITEPGTYILTGTLKNGMITVNAAGENDKVQLVLSGVDIYSDTGAAICVLDADKVFITLADGTENTLEVGDTPETVEGYEMNAAIYSRSDLTINGSGSLTVLSPAGHGISSKDDLAITGGKISVTCANQGLDANDSIRICGGEIAVDSGKDGIHAENADDPALGFVYISGGTMDLEAEGDGISASFYMQIANADITVLAGGGYENSTKSHSDGWGNMGGGFGGKGRPGKGGSSGSDTTDASESMKGLKATGDILISSGTVSLDTADDAIHADGSVTISGGSFAIAAGDDGVHAEDTLTITDCDMTISQAYEGLEAANIYVQGGEMRMNCSDDGLNAAGGVDESGTTGGRDGMFGGGGMGGGFGGSNYGYVEVSGGSLSICSGGDGLDSNGDLTISGGYVYVTNPNAGDVSVLDSQNPPIITGGTYIGLAISTMMAQTFSTASSQGVIACSVNGRIPSGSQITVTDGNGNAVIDVTAEYDIQLMIISSPDIVKGQTYTITAGSVSGEMEAN